MVVRGVPNKLAKDAWWLDDDRPAPQWVRGVWFVITLIVADQMIWAARGGLGFIVWIFVLGMAVHATLWSDVDRRRGACAWGLLVLSLVPSVELVQLTSVLIALLGLSAFAAVMVLGRYEVPLILRAMVRLPGFGLVQTAVDLLAVRMAVPSRGSFRGIVLDWAFPLSVGAVFAVLMVAANPVVDAWLVGLAYFDSVPSPDIGRILFCASAALIIWPFLRLAAMARALGGVPKPHKVRARSGLLNDRSVVRALIVFNLIFAVQSLLDIGYLWGGVALPEGMTYAEYAHRGAYPLLATALLAGVFALLAQPFLDGRPMLRVLLYVWVAQTVLLVVSSILRLDLYMDAYGMTRLRFAALVWMVIVALGLLLMIMQMVGRHTVGWFGIRAAALGLIAVYACSLINVDGLIARTNLAREEPDVWYLCDLSEGAVPALIESGQVCPSHQPFISTPADWREWGYRNARLRRSLSEMEVPQ